MKLHPKRSNTAYTAVVTIPSPFMLFLHPTQRFKRSFRSHTLQYQPQIVGESINRDRLHPQAPIHVLVIPKKK